MPVLVNAVTLLWQCAQLEIITSCRRKIFVRYSTTLTYLNMQTIRRSFPWLRALDANNSTLATMSSIVIPRSFISSRVYPAVIGAFSVSRDSRENPGNPVPDTWTSFIGDLERQPHINPHYFVSPGLHSHRKPPISNCSAILFCEAYLFRFLSVRNGPVHGCGFAFLTYCIGDAAICYCRFSSITVTPVTVEVSDCSFAVMYFRAGVGSDIRLYLNKPSPYLGFG